jgi:hypothetical protein
MPPGAQGDASWADPSFPNLPFPNLPVESPLAASSNPLDFTLQLRQVGIPLPS